MQKLLLLIILSVSVCTFGQIGMLDWRVHFSAFNATGIAQNDNEIFMATANGIVVYDKNDNNISTLDLTNGLSDLGVSSIDGTSDYVAVGYSNGNLDIIESTSITNIPWIKKSEISGDKYINNLKIDGTTLYVSSSIGLVIIDLEKMEVRDTYYPYENPTVLDFDIYKDTLFVASPDGIYKAHKDTPYLNDFNQWTKESNLPFYLLNAPFGNIETFGDKLMFSYSSDAFQSDSLYYFENGNFNEYSGNPLAVNALKVQDNKLLLSRFSVAEVLNENFEQEQIIFEVEGNFVAAKGILRHEGELWLADSENGMVRGFNSWDSRSIYKNTPYADGAYKIDIQYGTVIVAGGGLTHNLQPTYNLNGIYKFQNETWTNFNYTNQDSMDLNRNWDFIACAVNPNNTDEFAFGSSSQGGLMMVKDGATISEFYDENNSVLERTSGKIVITDMKYDAAGNLWILNKGVEPLKMLSPDGQWYSFTLGSAAKNKHPYRLLIDRDGVKWVGINQVGLVAFSDGGTIDDPNDDQWRTLSAAEGYGNLPSLFVKALAQDVDGEIWIGTDFGMVVLYNTSNVFDGGYGEYDASEILINDNGTTETVLGESDITSITVDGGNRKWIATSTSGVFCLSPDGTEEVYRYNTSNSPLISDNVLDVRSDLLSGETYFATESGLISVRTDATLADPEFNNVTVFPNPVRPDYSGPITVQGLGYQSDVRVTDVSGNVVYKTISNGGTVIWDGKNLQGERVQSGVYLVWTAVTDGKGKNVAKILFIN